MLSMMPLELTELLRIGRRRFLLLLLPILLSAALALPDLLGGQNAAGHFTTQIRYSAAQQMNLPQRDGDYQDVWLASELTVNAFTDWARSSSFRAEIHANLADDAVDLAGLGIAADNARSIGLIYLSHADAANLQSIADAAMTVLASRSQAYFPQLGGEAAQVTILDAPQISAAPPALSNRFAPLLRLGVGLFLGLLLVMAAEYLDQTVRHPNELRRMGMTVIGQIPRGRA